ncbi:unnamed protein product [Danaus chrysippus]|uniref:(African queen) hypothetical protein n=1 Tax=Danaus chrysippus TaxID=151541 RepID=A0A8J2QDX6_9NEOP|nr:unnamed protein product [Danaus chrysippus]
MLHKPSGCSHRKNVFMISVVRHKLACQKTPQITFKSVLSPSATNGCLIQSNVSLARVMLECKFARRRRCCDVIGVTSHAVALTSLRARRGSDS